MPMPMSRAMSNMFHARHFSGSQPFSSAVSYQRSQRGARGM